MKTIKFTEQEYESMIMMYMDELAEAQEYVEQIKEILKKLNAEPDKELVAKQPQKRGRKPQVKTIEKPEPKKLGRKPKVESVVTSLLTTAPKKVVKAVAKKKSVQKQREQDMATSANLKKPTPKKNAKVKQFDESAPVEPTVAPKE